MTPLFPLAGGRAKSKQILNYPMTRLEPYSSAIVATSASNLRIVKAGPFHESRCPKDLLERAED